MTATFSSSQEVLDLYIWGWVRHDGDDAYIETKRGQKTEETKFWQKCPLCDSPFMSCSAMLGHRREPRHQERQRDFHRDVDRMQHMLSRAIRLFTQPIVDQIRIADQIGDPTRRDAVQAGLFRYLTNPSNDFYTYDMLEQSLLRLQRYQCEEGLIILALAVWKSRCLIHMPETADYLSLQQWARSGWKKRKVERCDRTNVAIIVDAVRPFLREPSSVGTPCPTNGSAPCSGGAHVPVLSCQFDGVLDTTLAHFNRARFEIIKFEGARGVGEDRCVMCDHGGMDHEYSSKYHCFEPNHCCKVAFLRSDLAKLRTLMERYFVAFSLAAKELAPLDHIHHLPWRDTVQAGLFRYMSLDFSSKLEDESLQLAIQQLQCVEHWERQVVLALAVWKSQCLLEMPKGLGYSESQQWVRSSWKAFKEEKKTTNAVAIVLEQVRPFLGPPVYVTVRPFRRKACH
jgi:hypothetical protein